MHIEKYCEALERKLLDEFDEYSKTKNLLGMQTMANLLYNFNGGTSCMQSFISQHPFFLEQREVDGNQSRYTLQYFVYLNFSSSELDLASAKPNHLPPVDPGFQRLCMEVEKVCITEWRIISCVFNNPKQVMQRLVSRIFAQTVCS